MLETFVLAMPTAVVDEGQWLTRVEDQLDVWASSLGRSGESVLRLVLAAVLGGVVGAEREIRGHEAGFRTFMLVSAGAALAMVVSQSFAYADWSGPEVNRQPSYDVVVDPARIAYGVMTGVGFLGAGTIVQHRNRVQGLTTAAGIWAMAALGLAAGFGLYVVSVSAAILLLVTLTVLGPLRERFPTRQTRRLRVRVPYAPDCVDRFRDLVQEHGVRVRDTGVSREPESEWVTLDLELRYSHTRDLERLQKWLMREDQAQLLQLHML